MKTLALSAVAWVLPLMAFAQVRNIQEASGLITSIINGVLVPLVFAIAFIVFIWGVFKYFIMGGSNPESREEGQKLMLYGLIGFFLMVSVWGLVNILVGTFQLSQTPPSLPNAPGPGAR